MPLSEERILSVTRLTIDFDPAPSTCAEFAWFGENRLRMNKGRMTWEGTCPTRAMH